MRNEKKLPLRGFVIALFYFMSFSMNAEPQQNEIQAPLMDEAEIALVHLSDSTSNEADYRLSFVPSCILSLSPNGPTGQFTIQNRSASIIARDIASIFTGTLLQGNVTESGNTCSVLEPGQTCTLTYTPGPSIVPLTEFPIRGSNTRVITAAISIQATFTTLSVNPTGTIPASLLGNQTNNITVTNTGTTVATNVHAVLPGAWTSVTQDASNCVTVAPNGGTCTLTFSSTEAYIAEGNIVVTGDNVTTPPTMAIAFTNAGFLIWEITPVSVIDNVDPGFQIWSLSTTLIGAVSNDGIINTDNIVNNAVQPSAAKVCYDAGWYLPSICQLGGVPASGDPCSSTNTINHLFMLGFGNLLDTVYWSSNEDNGSNAWLWLFASDGSSTALPLTKTVSHRFRCAQALPLT